jgi:hydrogenase maturation protease
MPNKPTGFLIIGIGNEYRRDDAAGLVAARRLQAQLGEIVTILEQSGDGAVLMEMWKEARRVILIDAVSSGAAPGTIHRLDAKVETIPAKFFNYSTHAFGVAEAIAMATALNQLPPELVIYGIEGKSFAAGVELSMEVARAIDEVVERIKKEIRQRQNAPSAE